MTKGNSLRLLLCATTASVLVMGAPAFAQDAGQNSGTDIIVTAQRVEQRLQDVPISVTVFSQEKLANNNIVSSKDLAVYTPSVTVNSRYGTDFTTFTIRGFTQELRTTATVGTYFADVIAPRGSGVNVGGDGAGPGQLFDLQNVQILKGPQGTLFGRNTTGGAVLLVPRKPTDALEGYVEGTIGEYDLRRVQAVVNLPISDTFRVRLGVDRNTRDGYLKNLGNIGVGRYGPDMASVNYWAGRASVIADLTPDLENYTIASFTDSRSSGSIPAMKHCFPGINFSNLPIGNESCNQIAREKPHGFWTVSNALADTESTIKQWQVINTTTWRASDSLTIKNIVSYAEFRSTGNFDLFGNYFPIGVPAGQETLPSQVLSFVPIHAESSTGLTNAQSTFVEELRFQGTGMSGALEWQAGLYYEDSRPLGGHGVQNSQFTPCANLAAFNCVPATTGQSLGVISWALYRNAFKGKAAYAQSTLDATDKLSFTAGIRYTKDTSTSHLQVENIALRTTGTTASCSNRTAPGFGTAYPLEQRFDICKQFLKKSTSAPTWLLGVDYKPIPDVLLYAKYTRGYRQGGVSPASPDTLQQYEAEKVDTYEAGLKSSWRGPVPGSFNISGFYNDFSNQQLQIGVACDSNRPNFKGNCSPTTTTLNAGKSRIFGFEADVTVSPFEGLRLEAAYAYLNTKIIEIAPIALPADSLYNDVRPLAAGDSLPFAMPRKLTASVNYILPLPEEVGRISAGGTLVKTSRYRVVTGVYGEIPGYTFGNVNLNWDGIAGTPIDASLFITNVTNKKMYTHVNDQATRGFLSYLLAEPRMWGLRLRYSFGD